MSRHISAKLNPLLQNWPAGVVLTSKWLSENGYYQQLVKKYVASGWLKRIGHGAYLRLNDELTWAGAVCAMQKDLALPVHLGGLSALAVHGLAHYIQFGQYGEAIFDLYNTSKKHNNIPSWFEKCFPNNVYIQKHLFDEEFGLVSQVVQGVEIKVSSAERAILEVLSQVPSHVDYAHAFEVSENLTLIRPDRMQTLLEACTSYKVKRLFLYLADAHQLPCFKKLDISRVNVGKGKIVIGEGGHYVAEHRLSVPIIKREAGDGDV